MAAKTLANPPRDRKPDSIPISDLMDILARMESLANESIHRAVGQERMADALRALGTLYCCQELRRRISHSGLGVSGTPESTRLEL